VKDGRLTAGGGARRVSRRLPLVAAHAEHNHPKQDEQRRDPTRRPNDHRQGDPPLLLLLLLLVEPVGGGGAWQWGQGLGAGSRGVGSLSWWGWGGGGLHWWGCRGWLGRLGPGHLWSHTPGAINTYKTGPHSTGHTVLAEEIHWLGCQDCAFVHRRGSLVRHLLTCGSHTFIRVPFCSAASRVVLSTMVAGIVGFGVSKSSLQLFQQRVIE